jgi:hypothetical protein
VLWEAGIRSTSRPRTATPPSWLIRRHPEMLPWNEDGRRLEFGSRQAYCPSSPSGASTCARWPGDGRTLRRAPRARALARLERVRRPRVALLVPRVIRPLPPLARGALRRPRRAERGVGRERVGPALHRVGAHRGAAPGDRVR